MPTSADWNGFQTLAWIAWRSHKAVCVFSGEDAQQLWQAAKVGQYPKGLGRPKTMPVAAEMELQAATQIGRLTARLVPRHDD